MTPPKGTCRKCGGRIESLDTAAYAIEGYEVERSAGGANHVRDKRRVDGMIWHARYRGDCLDQHLDGERPEALFA